MSSPYSFYYLELHAREKADRAQKDAADYRLLKEIQASRSENNERLPVGFTWAYRIAFLFTFLLVIGTLTL